MILTVVTWIVSIIAFSVSLYSIGLHLKTLLTPKTDHKWKRVDSHSYICKVCNTPISYNLSQEKYLLGEKDKYSTFIFSTNKDIPTCSEVKMHNALN